MSPGHEMLQQRSQSGFCRGDSIHSFLYSIAHVSNKDLLSTYFALGLVSNAEVKVSCSHGVSSRSSEKKRYTYRVSTMAKSACTESHPSHLQTLLSSGLVSRVLQDSHHHSDFKQQR